jgi:hypothetical protein
MILFHAMRDGAVVQRRTVARLVTSIGERLRGSPRQSGIVRGMADRARMPIDDTKHATALRLPKRAAPACRQAGNRWTIIEYLE